MIFKEFESSVNVVHTRIGSPFFDKFLFNYFDTLIGIFKCIGIRNNCAELASMERCDKLAFNNTWSINQRSIIFYKSTTVRGFNIVKVSVNIFC